MKTFLTIGMLTFAGLNIGLNSFANTIQVDEMGKIYVAIGASLRFLNQEEMMAYDNPKIEIPIWDEGVVVQESFFYRVTVHTSSNSVIYDGNSVQYIETEERFRKSNRRFLMHKAIIFLAASFMILGGILKKKNSLFAPLAAFAACIAFVFAIFPFGYATVFSYLACISASIAVAATAKERNVRLVFSKVFYVASIIAFLT